MLYCGKQISNKASVCHNCGYPISKYKRASNSEKFVYEIIEFYNQKNEVYDFSSFVINLLESMITRLGLWIKLEYFIRKQVCFKIRMNLRRNLLFVLKKDYLLNRVPRVINGEEHKQNRLMSLGTQNKRNFNK